MYRREINFHPLYQADDAGGSPFSFVCSSFNDENAGASLLSVSKKIQLREGLCFRNSPLYRELQKQNKEAEESGGGGGSSSGGSSSSDYSTMTLNELKEQVKNELEKDEKMEKKRKRKKDPTVKEVREHLRTIAQYHEKEMEKSIPSIYPVLGVAGENSSDSDGEGNAGDGGGGRIFNPAGNYKKHNNKKKSGKSTLKKQSNTSTSSKRRKK